MFQNKKGRGYRDGWGQNVRQPPYFDSPQNTHRFWVIVCNIRAHPSFVKRSLQSSFLFSLPFSPASKPDNKALRRFHFHLPYRTYIRNSCLALNEIVFQLPEIVNWNESTTPRYRTYGGIFPKKEGFNAIGNTCNWEDPNVDGKFFKKVQHGSYNPFRRKIEIE